MTFRTLLALALPLGFTLACGALQSYAGGLQVICDAPLTCTECMEADAEVRQTFLARHIEEQLWNGSAQNAFEALAYADPETRVAILRQEAAQNGLESCPLADFFETEMREMRDQAVQQICAISTDCGTFDASDPATLAPCLEAFHVPPDVQRGIDDIDTTTPETTAEGLQRLAAAAGHPACAAAAAYRNAP